MKKNLIESMTAARYRRYHLRLWREEEDYSEDVKKQTAKDVQAAIVELDTERKAELPVIEIAKKLLVVDRMNAVEVVDAGGNGIVVYKEWP